MRVQPREGDAPSCAAGYGVAALARRWACQAKRAPVRAEEVAASPARRSAMIQPAYAFGYGVAAFARRWACQAEAHGSARRLVGGDGFEPPTLSV